MKAILVALAATMLATAGQAATFMSSAGAPDPGAAAGETVLFDFNSVTPELSGQFSLVTGTVGGAATPALDTTQYVAVPTLGLPSGTASLDLTGLPRQLKSFSFYWGSIDTYNSIALVGPGGVVFQTIAGGMLPPANGDQGAAATNRRVFVSLGAGETLNSINFNSSNIAFEFDDFAGSYVPEPQSWAMLVLGFGMIGAVTRRRAGPRSVTA